MMAIGNACNANRLPKNRNQKQRNAFIAAL